MTEFRREAGICRRPRIGAAPRNLVLLAAYLGSPASCTARAIDVQPLELRAMVSGSMAPTLIEMERLHDWIACSLWRHLWRAGSPEHATPDAIEEAVTHAARLAEVPPEWARDWAFAASGVRP